MKKSVLALAAAVVMTASASQAAVVFSDDFSSYGSTTRLNAPDTLFGGNWSTAGGTIDYLAAGDSFGNLCVGGGNCIDLDGSTAQAGVFSSKTFGAGRYTLDISMFGSQRSGYEAETVTITLGNWSVTLGPINTFDDASNSWTFTTTGGAIGFSNAGGDNVGAILTGVTLSAVPLPATAPLLLAGLGLIGAAAKRRRKSASV